MNTPSNRLHARCLVALFALAAPGLAMAQEPVRRTPGAEAFRAALDMAPPTAVSVVVVPNPKMAADDLAECMARLDQAAGALPLRPLDLLKSRFGIGPGIDDTRAFVMWHEVDPDQTAHPQVPAMLVPVTDAKAFLEGNFKPVEGVRSAWTNDSMGTVYARTIDRHVLISQSAGIVSAYGLKPGFAASLRQRLGDRGYEVFTSGDAGAWAGLEAMKSMRETAAQMQGGADRPARAAPARGNADAQAPAQPSAPPSADPVQRADLDGSGTIDNGDLSMLMLEMGNRGNLPADLNGDGVVDETDASLMRSYQGRTVASAVPADAPVEAPAATPAPATPTERANQIADGVIDGVFAIDMDPLGMSVRTYAVMDPRSEIGQSARGGTRGARSERALQREHANADHRHRDQHGELLRLHAEPLAELLPLPLPDRHQPPLLPPPDNAPPALDSAARSLKYSSKTNFASTKPPSTVGLRVISIDRTVTRDFRPSARLTALKSESKLPVISTSTDRRMALPPLRPGTATGASLPSLDWLPLMRLASALRAMLPSSAP